MPSDGKAADSGRSVGQQLRNCRHEKGLTLEQLSDRSGLSAGFLSQMERGISSLSIVSFQKVCSALGVSPHTLFPDAGRPRLGWEDSKLVHGPHQRFAIEIQGVLGTYHYLSASFPGRVLEVLISQFPEGYVQTEESHEGEEFGYVLEGELTLTIEHKTYVLLKEHTFHIPSGAKHSYRVASGATARILMVSTGRVLDQLRENW